MIWNLYDSPINRPSGTWTKFSPRPRIEYEEIDEEPILEHPCDQVNLCQHKCRRTPLKDGVNFQCQCEKKFKPDPDDPFKCLPGDKIIDKTYCDEDSECFDEFPNSQCGIFACECMLGAQ